MSTYVPTIDALLARLEHDGLLGDPRATPEAILAVGRDVGIQLGRIADHLTIEAVVAQTGRFGEVAAGRDPNIATKDDARGHRQYAAPITP